MSLYTLPSSRSISIGDLRAVAQSGVDLYDSSDDEGAAKEYCRFISEDVLPRGFDPDGAVVVSELRTTHSVRVIPTQPPSSRIMAVLRKLIGIPSSAPSAPLEELSPEARAVLYLSLFPVSASSVSSAKQDFFEDLIRGIGASSQPLEISEFLDSQHLISVDRRREFVRQRVPHEPMIEKLLSSETLFGRFVVLTYPTHFSCHVLAHACNIQFLSSEKEWQELFDSLRAQAVSQKVHSIVGLFPFQIPLEDLFKRHPSFLIPVLKTLDEVLGGRWGGRELQLLRQLFKNHPEFTLLGYQLLNRLHFHPFYILSHLLYYPNEKRKPSYRLGEVLDKQVLEAIGMPPLAFFPFSIQLVHEDLFRVTVALASPSHFFYKEELVEFSYPCRGEDLKTWFGSNPRFDLRTVENRDHLSPPILICQVLGGMMGELYAYSHSMNPNLFKDQYIDILRRKYCDLMGVKEEELDKTSLKFLLDQPDVLKDFIEVLSLYSLLSAKPIVKPKDIRQITSKIASFPSQMYPLVVSVSTKVQNLVSTNAEIILSEFKSMKANLGNNLSSTSRGLKEVDLHLPDDWIIESEMTDRMVTYFSLCLSAAAANAVYGYGTQCLVSQGREGLEENKKLQLSYESFLRESMPDTVKQVLERLYQVAYIDWTQQGSAVKKAPKTLDEAIKEIGTHLKRLGIEATLDGLDKREDLVQGLAVHVRACSEFRTGCMQALRTKTSFNGKAGQFGKIQINFMEFVNSFSAIDEFPSLVSLVNTVLQATYPTNIQVLTDMMVLACRSGQSIKEDPHFSRAGRNLNTTDCPCVIPLDSDGRDLALYLRGYIPRYNERTSSTKKLYSCFRVETETPYGEDGKRIFQQGDFVVGYASAYTVAEVAIPLDLRPLNLDFLRTDLFVQELSTFVALEASEAQAHIDAAFKTHPYISSLEDDSREQTIVLFTDFRNRAEQALAEVFFQSTSRLDLTGSVGASSRKVRGVREAPGGVKVINLADEIQAIQYLDQLLKDGGLEKYTATIRPFYRDSNFREAIKACLVKQKITDKTMFLGKVRQLAKKIWPGHGDEDKQAREAFQRVVKEAQGLIT